MSKTIHAGAPPVAPRLLSRPLPLPATFHGDWAGSTAVYNLDRVEALTYMDRAQLTVDLEAAQADLSARKAAAVSVESAAATALDLEQQKLLHQARARGCAYFCEGVTLADGRTFGALDDIPSWEALSLAVVRWLANEGLAAALEELNAPFHPMPAPAPLPAPPLALTAAPPSA